MKASWKWLLYSSMGLGLLLLLSGVGLAMFSNMSVSMGLRGVQIIAGIIGLGLLLLVPSKILLTLLLMREQSSAPPANNKG